MCREIQQVHSFAHHLSPLQLRRMSLLLRDFYSREKRSGLYELRQGVVPSVFGERIYQ